MFVVDFIVEQIQSLISYMKDIYFTDFLPLPFGALSFFDLFVGLGVGATLCDIFLSVFGESVDDIKPSLYDDYDDY